ncbi:group 1 truncated hemoglobin [Deltaproteobacteria bacterium TL4]
MRGFLNLIIIGMCLGGLGCSSTPQEQPKLKESLYLRLGGETAITAIVQDFTERIANNEQLNPHFKETDFRILKQRLIEQFCELTGGPCQYQGASMKEAHQGKGLTQKDLDLWLAELKNTLMVLDIPVLEQNELFLLLSPMRKDLVGEEPGAI